MDETRRQLLRSWLTKAANDLKSARVLRADPEGPLDSAIYHCQQAGEKAVKAFLVFKEISPAKTHDIRKLAIEAAEIEPLFDKLIPDALRVGVSLSRRSGRNLSNAGGVSRSVETRPDDLRFRSQTASA
jgi:HEPN domain-containing protein